MNYKLLLFILGWILKFESAFLLLPVITGLCFKEYREAFIYVGVSALCLLFG